MKGTAGTLAKGLALIVALGAMLPMSEARAQSGGEQSYTAFGEKEDVGGVPVIDSLELLDADVRSVFKMLSKHSGVDIVLSEKVSGAVTLRLTNKTWREVFVIVCRILDLEPVKEDNYFYVVTNQEYEAQMLAEAGNAEIEDKLAPMERHIIPLSNTTAKEMVQPVSMLLSANRGRITVVEHNNALIVYDTKENIRQIRNLVEKLDIETAQISISCKIIEVNSGEAQNIGIHWGFFNPSAGIQGSHLPKPDPDQGVNVVAGAIDKLTYGILSPERFSVALEYLFTDNRGEVVAQPSITTLDNKQARIFTGQQVPVVHLDEAGNSVVTLIDAGTEMTVTPHVTGEGRIMLDLNPKKKSYTLSPSDQPIIHEQSAQTNVVVNDGETVVIAGLTSNEVQNAESGIPFLKDIPIIGNLFKRSQKERANKDLIIFVTPHIIERKLSTTTPRMTEPPALQEP